MEKYWLELSVLSVAAYLIGNISFATIVSKIFKKKNIRDEGSGNPGTMNMLRTYGAALGILTLLLDVVKGLLPCLAARIIFDKISGGETRLLVADTAMYICGLFVIIGHIYPVFFRFRGGKGVASTLGIFFLANPLVMSAVFLISIVYLFFFEYGSVTSFICIIALIVERGIYYNNYFMTNALPGNILLSCTLFALVFLTLFAHRQNISRLLTDAEHKTSLKKILKIKSKDGY